MWRYWFPTMRSASEQARKYVLVVDDSGVVRQKYVTLGQLDDGLRVIKDGLVATDRVIVNGLMHARPGIKVDAREENTPASPARPQSRAMKPKPDKERRTTAGGWNLN